MGKAFQSMIPKAETIKGKIKGFNYIKMFLRSKKKRLCPKIEITNLKDHDKLGKNCQQNTPKNGNVYKRNSQKRKKNTYIQPS